MYPGQAGRFTAPAGAPRRSGPEFGYGCARRSLGLFRRSPGWAPDGPGAPARDAQPAPPVTSQLFPGHHIILSHFEIDELRRNVEQQRGIDLVAVHRLFLTLEQIGEIDAENVDH